MKKNRLIIGGNGVGKSMVITRMNADKYHKFSAFCKQNDYEYHITASITLSKQYVDISCEKKVLEMFNSAGSSLIGKVFHF